MPTAPVHGEACWRDPPTQRRRSPRSEPRSNAATPRRFRVEQSKARQRMPPRSPHRPDLLLGQPTAPRASRGAVLVPCRQVERVVREAGLYLKQNMKTPNLKGGPKPGTDGASRIARHYKYSLSHAFDERKEVTLARPRRFAVFGGLGLFASLVGVSRLPRSAPVEALSCLRAARRRPLPASVRRSVSATRLCPAGWLWLAEYSWNHSARRTGAC